MCWHSGRCAVLIEVVRWQTRRGSSYPRGGCGRLPWTKRRLGQEVVRRWKLSGERVRGGSCEPARNAEQLRPATAPPSRCRRRQAAAAAAPPAVAPALCAQHTQWLRRRDPTAPTTHPTTHLPILHPLLIQVLPASFLSNWSSIGACLSLSLQLLRGLARPRDPNPHLNP